MKNDVFGTGLWKSHFQKDGGVESDEDIFRKLARSSKNGGEMENEPNILTSTASNAAFTAAKLVS
jgi:hypothetical protein